MLKKDQTILVRWNPRNKKYYCEKGYTFTKINDVLKIKVEDLQPCSHLMVVAICDYCGREYEVSMTNYTRSIKDRNKIACKFCKSLKTKDSLEEKYGVPVSFLIPEVQEQIKTANLEKYGCENVLSNLGIREKVKKTMMDRHGAEHPAQSSEILNKIKNTTYSHYGAFCIFGNKNMRERISNTMREKYGESNSGLIKRFVDKAKETCLERYGGESSQCSPEIRQKSFETMKGNNGIPTSRKEQELVSMIKDLFGEENSFPQYILDKISLDCLVYVNDMQIDIEYDGWYWHKNQTEKDKRRDYYTISRGIKVLRYRSNGSLPSTELLQEDIQKLTTTNKKIIVHYLDNIQEEDIV